MMAKIHFLLQFLLLGIILVLIEGIESTTPTTGEETEVHIKDIKSTKTNLEREIGKGLMSNVRFLDLVKAIKSWYDSFKYENGEKFPPMHDLHLIMICEKFKTEEEIMKAIESYWYYRQIGLIDIFDFPTKKQHMSDELIKIGYAFIELKKGYAPIAFLSFKKPDSKSAAITKDVANEEADIREDVANELADIKEDDAINKFLGFKKNNPNNVDQFLAIANKFVTIVDKYALYQGATTNHATVIVNCKHLPKNLAIPALYLFKPIMRYIETAEPVRLEKIYLVNVPTLLHLVIQQVIKNIKEVEILSEKDIKTVVPDYYKPDKEGSFENMAELVENVSKLMNNQDYDVNNIRTIEDVPTETKRSWNFVKGISGRAKPKL